MSLIEFEEELREIRKYDGLILPDPRFQSVVNKNPPYFHYSKSYEYPVSAMDDNLLCGGGTEPGYQKMRYPYLNYSLQVNDYPYHSVQLRGGYWNDLIPPYNYKRSLKGLD